MSDWRHYGETQSRCLIGNYQYDYYWTLLGQNVVVLFSCWLYLKDTALTHVYILNIDMLKPNPEKLMLNLVSV